MTTAEFLTRLRGLGVKLWLDGESLRFSAAKEAITPALRAELVERKAGIVDLLRAAADEGANPYPPVLPGRRDREVPLSYAQQRLWFLDQLEPGRATYNVPAATRLVGPVEVGALARSLNAVVARHESLRTTFPADEGRPRQEVAPGMELPLDVEDLSGLAPAAREAAVRELARAEAARPFDLARGPLLRARLLRLGPAEHVLLVTLHHIVTDGWSLGVLLRELTALYPAACRGELAALPPLPVQYRDYALWQRDRLQGPVLERQLAYWRERLAGAPAALELPTDRPRPPTQSFQGATATRRLPAVLVGRLRALAEREGATTFMALLAGFQALLGRYAGQSDVVVGTPIANRPRPELEGLIGFFANTLAVRADLSGAPSFRALLGRVKQSCLGAYAHQDLPFERLVEELRPERDPSRSPLIQTMFVYENAPRQPLTIPGLSVEFLEPPDGVARLDLAMVVAERADGGAQATVEYSSDLFDAETIERLLGHYQRLLEGAVSDADRAVEDLPLLLEAERARLLAWSGDAADRPRDACAHELFEAQAARTPDAIAVVGAGERLTYAELDARANQLAHHLIALGVGAETRVGICLERSVETIVALLAVLKAGGAYLPLDTAYPPERLAFMLADAKVPVMVTQSALRAKLPRYDGQRVCLDEQSAAIARQPTAPPPAAVGPANLAYIIYTSGSTGRPKGVMLAHGGLCNLALEAIRAYRVEADSRVLQAVSFGFDVATCDVFMALLAGAALHVTPGETALTGPELVGLLREGEITHLEMAAPVVAAFAREPLPALTTLVVGGEPSAPDVVAFWASGRHFVNAYGPTETTVCATVDEYASGRDLTLGRPLANMRVYVVDARMQPVPIGLAGELLIGGDGVARGYLDRPGLTAERFVPDPFAGRPGARLYRSGDLVRWRPDGRLEFLGRVDQQVKVRGFRIEPGEIESALAQHPDVREAAVVAREDRPGHRRLVAYIVATDPARRAGATELRDHLGARLPEYMLPAAFVALDALPLTPNGKLDRRALPAPEVGADDRAEPAVAPRTPAEQTLAGVWADVLGRPVERVGVHDNFFELGGDSILSIQVIARAARAGLQLTPRQLFQHQTVAALAAVAVATPAAEAEQGRLTGPVPPTPFQLDLLARDRASGDAAPAIVMVEIAPPEGAEIVEAALEALLEHHDALRLSVVAGPGGWELSHAEGRARLSCALVDLTLLEPARLDAATETAAAALSAGLDRRAGRLAGAAWLDLGPDRASRLLLAVDRLIADDAAAAILRQDLELALAQLSRGQAARLPAKTTSFRRWAELLRADELRAAVRAELPDWLDPARARARPLPVAGPTSGTAVGPAGPGAVALWLEADETEALRRAAPAYRARPDDLLLTALAEAFAGWTGERALLVELTRDLRADMPAQADLSRTVGQFASRFPALLDLPARAGHGQAIKAIKEQLRRVPRNGVGHGLLRHLCQDDPAAARLAEMPPARVSFDYRDGGDPAVPAPAAAGAGGRLAVRAAIVAGRLRVDWTYDPTAYGHEVVERLAEGFLASLRGLIAHCLSPEAGGHTRSDFPLADLDQAAIDGLFGNDREIEAVYPLSPMQQGLLFHSLLAPDSEQYFVQLTWTLGGRVCLETLVSTWERLLERHPVLRTGFVWAGVPRPLQVSRRSVPLPWEEHDWRGTPRPEQEARLEALLAADRARPFDLARPPLMRLTVIRLADDRYQCVWSVHHLILDGWSTELLLKELFVTYQALVGGRDAALPPPRPFEDFIDWLQWQDRAAAEEYWRRQLDGFGAPTSLGLDRPPDALAAPHGDARERGEQWAHLSEATTAALAALARRHQVTLGTILQGAWALLLSRYSGEDDVLFGATVSGRPTELAGVDAMVGMFINTLPVRVPVPGQARLVEWLRELQAAQARQGEHEHCSLVELQGWSDVPRGQPLFESIVIIENYPAERPWHDQVAGRDGAGLEVSSARGSGRTHYPLEMVAHTGPRLAIEVAFDRSRFAADTGARVLSHLQTLLEGMLADPERRLDDLPILPAAERERVLVEWSATAADRPRAACIQDLVEAQATRTPDAIAVVHGDERLSYRELNARANRLAHHLRARGVGPETRVGVCVERSAEQVVAVLAVLKAGGAYVPLDPTYPTERLAFMLADARVEVLLARTGQTGSLPEQGAERICLDAERARIAGRSAANPTSGVRAENLAYVMYTSGSTGTPKGVAVTHRNVVRLVKETDYARLGADEVVLQFAPLAFDASTLELWGPLANGGRLAVVPASELP
ncbi:MAG TPA: amino acid adenylation domain-containing protein, partial [Chloroflexota bacterium]